MVGVGGKLCILSRFVVCGAGVLSPGVLLSPGYVVVCELS